jgi:hypothetical protein
MPQPDNLADYLERFRRNEGVEGTGLETSTVLPCPFCAAPRWAVFRVLQVQEELSRERGCKECGRTAKALFQQGAAGIAFEMVQVGGPEQPDWLEPKMRRVDA